MRIYFMTDKLTAKEDITPKNENEYKKGIGLSLLALVLDLAVIPTFYLIMDVPGLLFFIWILPVAGLIMGVTSLSRGVKRIGKAGRAIAIVAIALPLMTIAFILILFIGASVGIVSLM